MTTYNQLKKIIPADQALANKALQAGLEQIKNIFDATLPGLAGATVELESNVGLDAINDLTAPLPANVIAYFSTTFATGSGPDGLFLLTDLIGSITGVNISAPLANTTAILNTMTSEGDFASLTNGTTGVYTVMEDTAAADYTAVNPFSGDFVTTIPPGLPGTGTYTANTANASIANAFSSGLNPAMVSTVNSIVSANPDQVAETTANFTVISNQLQNEQINLALADVQFANLVPGIQPFGLVYNLASNGLDVVEGGTAFVLQSVANVATQGGQAIISTMREARNQELLNAAGMQTDILISDQYPEPAADLGTTQYTVSQAVSQKII